MSFINNKKYKEIREASKNGNEKAMAVMQALYRGTKQDALDRLLDDYYGVNQVVLPEVEEEVRVDTENPFEFEEQQEQVVEEEQQPAPVASPIEEELRPSEEEQPVPVSEVAEQVVEEQPTAIFDGDIMDSLKKDLDGLLDTNDIEDLSFGDFLKNKKRDALRSKKNADYFKAYSPESRQNYMTSNIDEYRKGFDGRLKNIERKYNDYGKSLGMYADKMNGFLDDDIELDVEKAGGAYDEFVDNENIMNSFGRYWDEADNNSITMELAELTKKYGKKNVMAALNSLGNDNENYKNFLNNQIDTEIDRYSKSLEKILK